MEMHQQGFFHPAVVCVPAETQRGFINKGTEHIAEGDNRTRLIALGL